MLFIFVHINSQTVGFYITTLAREPLQVPQTSKERCKAKINVSVRLKGHNQLGYMHIRYHFLANLHITGMRSIRGGGGGGTLLFGLYGPKQGMVVRAQRFLTQTAAIPSSLFLFLACCPESARS